MLVNLVDIFKAEFDDVGDSPSSPSFRNCPCGEFIGGSVNVVDLNTREALLKQRIDYFRINLCQRAVTVENALFLQRFFIEVIDGFSLRRSSRREHQTEKRNQKSECINHRVPP